MLSFKDKVVIVTGAGNGLGKDYALFFGSRGAKVVVNDLGSSARGDGNAITPAQKVVDQIVKNGGTAVANTDSVEFGEKIVKTAMDKFGRIDIVINNAGILRDVSFQKMTENDWDLINRVHVKGSYAVTKAAWNIMREQNYGRIINTSSSSGIYGNFGQSNYATAKLGLHGFTMSLAKEGEKRNIFVNTIAPVAASRMTESVLPKEALANLSPAYITPLVAYLCSEECQETGSLFEVAGGYVTKLRWNNSEGVLFDLDNFTPEEVQKNWEKLCSFDQNSQYPTGAHDTFNKVTENAERMEKLRASRPAKAPQAPASTAAQSKADNIFGLMRNYLAQGFGKDLPKKVGATFEFNITKTKGGPVISSYFIDLKNGQGLVKFEAAPNADARFTMTEDDFEGVCLGKLNPTNAFMTGKMKIKGNMSKANKFTPELFPAPTPENFAKYANTGPAGSPVSTPQSTPKGAPADVKTKSDKIFNLMRNFLAGGHGKDLIKKVGATYEFNITKTKGGPVISSYLIDLKNGQGSVEFKTAPSSDAKFTMTEDDFEAVCLGKLNPTNAFMTGKMKIKGNMSKANKFTPELFPPPTEENLKKFE